MNNSSSSSITALVPGGVVTTQNISTVIKPKENNNSMQFVKIQTPELSKKAVEQIRVAQESKITKEKIKEGEEEWQSNLLNWKSKRRQHFVGVHSNDNQNERNNNDANENGRKIKTFAEMIEERTKTGNRLNFHLERYIGSSESEQDNQDQADSLGKEISQLSLNNNNNNHLPHHPSQQNSSLNNISNLPNESALATSKNDTNQLVVQNGNGLQEEDGAADDEDDDYFDEMRPLNSTFKQGIDHPPTPPTIHSDDKIRLSLDVDTRTKEVNSASSFEDNASDHDDEEDEQEEEQKQLQRIAFVAKLKAFEKMTKPSMQEPKFVAPKTAKASPPPPPPPPPPPQVPSKSSQIPPVLTPPLRHRLQTQESLVRVEKVSQLETPKKPVAEMAPLVQNIEPEVQKQMPNPHVTKPPEQIEKVNQVQQPPPISSAPVQVQEARKEEPPRIPDLPKQPARKQAPPIPVQLKQQHSVPVQTNASIYEPQLPPKLAAPPELPSPIAPPSPHRHQAPKHQPPPRQQSHQPQPPLKDDKSQDRTVLSVSGKKRCSSCQEELGRGAAAFVIESLNLVYHTNCFRCSVCHVNLSNGFRGVDVRVHAGALHCQNCYSKDGLNFSRV